MGWKRWTPSTDGWEDVQVGLREHRFGDLVSVWLRCNYVLMCRSRCFTRLPLWCFGPTRPANIICRTRLPVN